MMTLIKDLPDSIVGFRYEGKVTAKDYETVLYPAVEEVMKKHKVLKVLCQLPETFETFDAGAALDDMAIGLRHYLDWKKIAFVSDKTWMNHAIGVFGFLIPGQVRSFVNSELDKAIKWLAE